MAGKRPHAGLGARLLELLLAVLVGCLVVVLASPVSAAAGLDHEGYSYDAATGVAVAKVSGETYSDMLGTPVGVETTGLVAPGPRLRLLPVLVAPNGIAALTRNSDGLFGSNVTQLRTRTSGGFVRDAGGPVRVFQSEVSGGRSAAEQFFTQQVGRAPNAALATNVAESGGLRYTIRGSSHGAPTVEVFDAVGAAVEKIRFLE